MEKLGYLFQCLRPYRWQILLTWLISIIILLVHGASLWLGAEFLEKLLVSGHTELNFNSDNAVIALLERITQFILVQDTPYQSLSIAVLALALAGIAVSLLRILKMLILAKFNQAIIFRLRHDLFCKLTEVDVFFSRQCRFGEISSLVVEDVNQLNYIFIDLLDRIFMQPLRLLIGIYLMVSVSLKITLITFCFLLPGVVFIHLAGDFIHKITRKVLNNIAQLQGQLVEFLSISMLSKLFLREDSDREKLTYSASCLKDENIKLMAMEAISPQIVRFLVILASSALILIGGHEVLVLKKMDGGDLLKLAFLLTMVSYPLESLGYLYISLKKSFASLNRIFTLLNETSFDESMDKGVRLNHSPCSLKLQNVGYQIGEFNVFKNINLNLSPGTLQVITGPSGSGKSSLLGILAKIYPYTSGSVLVNGEELSTLDTRYWRSIIGLIPQEAIFFNGSVLDNLKYAKKDLSLGEASDVLNRVKLVESFEEAKKFLGKNIGNEGSSLSGGERQRLSIARVLLTDPAILLIDEPTNNLDAENKTVIIELLNQLKQDRIVLVASHDEKLSACADRQYKLDHNKATVNGTAI